jgi:uncharacterized damage-inducible protein DinB
MPRPNLSEVPTFYHNYVNQVQSNSLHEAFGQHSRSLDFIKNIPDGKWTYRYAPDKWSIKELVQHIIDAERIFCYRALCFARKDKTALPGFDENSYAAASKGDSRNKKELLEELEIVQKASEKLFSSFDEEQLESTGTANGKLISVNSIGFITVGHTQHHANIIRERYL